MKSQGSGLPKITPRHEANYAVKTKFVDALFAGDWATMETLVHPDFELREPAALPYGGVWKGMEGFRKCWALIPTTSHKTEHLDTLRTFFADDPDSIIVELDFHAARLDNGEKFGTKVMEQFEFKDGKISAIALYWFNIPFRGGAKA
ncbi:MAG: nuclear transport factor 2 family protein [Parvularculaceae bacterium]|nr:nuclear transport factor 2 family protein [Parvularculaceae bacterium]